MRKGVTMYQKFKSFLRQKGVEKKNKDPFADITKQNLLFFLDEEAREVRQFYINMKGNIPTDFAQGRLFQLRELKKKIEDSMSRSA